MKKSLLAAAIASTMVFAVGAEAANFKISGQVSRMAVAPDDAVGDEVQFQDIGWSGSRFRITGDHDIGNGFKAGFRLEEQLQSNAAGGATGDQETDNDAEDGDDSRDNRYQDIFVSGSFGKLALGKGDGASNGVTEDDLSGTALSSSSNHQDNWGGYLVQYDLGSDGAVGNASGFTPVGGTGDDQFDLEAVDSTETDTMTAWSSIFNMADGLSRQNRLRYDSPSFSGVSFAGSTGQGGHTEVAVRYRGNLSGIKVNASLGYADTEDLSSTPNEVTAGSLSVLFAGGFNATVAFSDEDRDGAADREAYTVKLGWKKGIHAFAVDYGEGELDDSADSEADTWGVTYAAHPVAGVEFFVTYRELDADIDGASTDSVDIFAIGSRVKF